jgi:propanol-preferring alcohol dehydrogenase
MHGVLVTAVSTGAFRQAIDMLRPHGVLALNGLPPRDFPTPIFDVGAEGAERRCRAARPTLDRQEE